MSENITAIFFIPGILGSELWLEEEKIWPPALSEIISGYQRLNSLRDLNAKAKNPILKVFGLKDIYGSLQQDLKIIADGIGAQFIPFGYDWRLNIQDTAFLLSEKIKSVFTEAEGKIALIAHSMGGLICRYLLESGDFSRELWFPHISLLVGLGVPNFGSPFALASAIGKKPSFGLSGSDLIVLSSDSNFPSLYQLIPPPNQSILWEVIGPNIKPINHFSDTALTKLKLSKENIEVAKKTWANLDVSKKPKSTQYVFLGGTGHHTMTRIELKNRSFELVEDRSVGDGTVPLWSSIVSQFQNAVANGDHNSFFKNIAARKLLYQIFGLLLPQQAFSAGEKELKPIIDISTQFDTYIPNAEIDIIILPLVPANRIEGEAWLERGKMDSNSEQVNFEPYIPKIPIIYQGPEIRLARLKMQAPGDPGMYRILFSGSHNINQAKETSFFVTPC